ncbi:hypothetical protein HAHE_06000 [Haloferula helveola]|uniref:Cytochrome c domain-containing protein n=1 Tax=Haloferula helveola TaxID=490095 RepID=A0ABM7R945_9BACT|nr:hypothetical protein HAHE_06000 [Haloferula helveola]
MIKPIGILLGILLLAGCASDEHDAMPDDPMRVLKTRSDVPPPTQEMASRSGHSLEHLRRGHSVFMVNCTRCHEPRIAVETGEPSWHPTMRGMSWNAGLKPADETALIDYVRAAARE